MQVGVFMISFISFDDMFILSFYLARRDRQNLASPPSGLVLVEPVGVLCFCRSAEPPHNMISHEELKEIISYDPETGLFRWRVKVNQRFSTHNPPGCLHNKYWSIRIKGKRYYAHRLAWFWVYGDWPKRNIDHKNRCPTDNRLINLREANSAENNRNRGIGHNNKSGVKGVYWREAPRRWQALVKKDGAWFGKTFKSLTDAESYVKELRQKLHGDFYHD